MQWFVYTLLLSKNEKVDFNKLLLFIQCVCAAPHDSQVEVFFPESFGNADYTNLSIIVGQYECLTKALETVSQSNGLNDLVALSKSKFAANIAKWKKCGESQSYMGLMYVNNRMTFPILKPTNLNS